MELFEQDLGLKENKEMFVENGKIKAETFKTLETRFAKEKPEFLGALKKLKALMGPEKFEKRINVLQNINKSGNNLLVVAGNERLRTLLLKEDVKAIMDAFEVDNVRIVGGSGFGGLDAF